MMCALRALRGLTQRNRCIRHDITERGAHGSGGGAFIHSKTNCRGSSRANARLPRLSASTSRSAASRAATSRSGRATRGASTSSCTRASCAYTARRSRRRSTRTSRRSRARGPAPLSHHRTARPGPRHLPPALSVACSWALTGTLILSRPPSSAALSKPHAAHLSAGTTSIPTVPHS